jgi:hypothetical protein
VPKLLCPCGYIHNLSPIPDEGYVTYRDAAPEIILYPTPEQLDLEERDLAIEQEEGSLYECPLCDRILWKRPGDELFRIYRPE